MQQMAESEDNPEFTEFRNMKFTVDGPATLELEAKLIALQSSQREGVTRWAELTVHVTRKNTYICQIKGKSADPREKTLYSTLVTKKHSEMVTFFGSGTLGSKLLSTIGIKK